VNRTHQTQHATAVCMQVTEGPDAGKLALLDFGLVAEIPPADRAAMVSATIHLVSAAFDWCSCVCVREALARGAGRPDACRRPAPHALPRCHPPAQANRNWSALVDDFVDLEFLPADANRCVPERGAWRPRAAATRPRACAKRTRCTRARRRATLLQGCHHPRHGARPWPLPAGRRRQGVQLPGAVARPADDNHGDPI
jgi:hypothetical protein